MQAMVIVPRLPMRNWNAYDEGGWLNEPWRSTKTTYEELKLANSVVAQLANQYQDYLWGIETLKSYILIPIVLSTKTTYEELKHAMLGGIRKYR